MIGWVCCLCWSSAPGAVSRVALGRCVAGGLHRAVDLAAWLDAHACRFDLLQAGLRPVGESWVSLPWLLLPASLLLLALMPSHAAWWFVSVILMVTAIVQQCLIRRWTRQRFDMPITYWWLMGAGGLLVGAIGPVSVWRTLTGRGWTWKGRQLT